VALVFQDVYLFEGTIEENIRAGRPGATDEEVREAARLAQAEVIVERLPDGYQTTVGEGGARLSGGERQRISIARAILKGAAIVLLDEATAALDPENEAAIQTALTALTRDKTLLAIAHRLQTITAAGSASRSPGGTTRGGLRPVAVAWPAPAQRSPVRRGSHHVPVDRHPRPMGTPPPTT
jgi:ATP-binding cassette subfamily B protein IrtB